jgi:acid phosphatase type 7
MLNSLSSKRVFEGGLVLAVVACVLAVNSFAESPEEGSYPSRIMLNLTARPAHSIAVTWRTLLANSVNEVEFAAATINSTFADSTSKVAARTETLQLEKAPVAYYHSAIIEGLKPATAYVYRVGHDSIWSEWNQFTTADDMPSPFTFVFFGDPQDDIREFVSRPFREAFRSVPGARFWLFTGDLTTNPDDRLWDEWYQAAGFINALIPSIMVPGNHDHESIKVNGKKERTNKLPLWRTLFTLPENGVSGLEETSYFVDYQGVRIVMLNSNQRLTEQATWLDSLLAHNTQRWTVLAFHHPLYSTGRSRDGRETRDALLSIIDKYRVDLVLQGHDHTYGRSHKLVAGSVVPDSAKGTVYVVSSSGPKNYVLQTLYKDLMAKLGENIQLYQVISVSGDTLQLTATTAAGTVYDSFKLRK